jgi:hypothetical protein
MQLWAKCSRLKNNKYETVNCEHNYRTTDAYYIEIALLESVSPKAVQQDFQS